MKLLGIDYGKRRIGVAATEGTIPRGVRVIDRKREPDFMKSLLSLICDEDPERIIIGLPLTADDGETPMSREIRLFGEQLAQTADITVQYIDESFTSLRAGELLLCRKRKKRRDKSSYDLTAACLILEACLREGECALL